MCNSNVQLALGAKEKVVPQRLGTGPVVMLSHWAEDILQNFLSENCL